MSMISYSAGPRPNATKRADAMKQINSLSNKAIILLRMVAANFRNEWELSTGQRLAIEEWYEEITTEREKKNDQN